MVADDLPILERSKSLKIQAQTISFFTQSTFSIPAVTVRSKQRCLCPNSWTHLMQFSLFRAEWFFCLIPFVISHLLHVMQFSVAESFTCPSVWIFVEGTLSIWKMLILLSGQEEEKPKTGIDPLFFTRKWKWSVSKCWRDPLGYLRNKMSTKFTQKTS